MYILHWNVQKKYSSKFNCNSMIMKSKMKLNDDIVFQVSNMEKYIPCQAEYQQASTVEKDM